MNRRFFQHEERARRPQRRRIRYVLWLCLLGLSSLGWSGALPVAAQSAIMAEGNVAEGNVAEGNIAMNAEQRLGFSPSLPPFVPGEITVGIGADVVWTAEEHFGGLPVLAVFPMSPDLQPAGEATSSNAYTLLLRTEPGQEWAEIERLAHAPGVSFALPNWTAQAAWLPETGTPETGAIERGTASDHTVQFPSAEPVITLSDPFYEHDQWYLQRVQAMRAWGLAMELSGGRANLTRVRVAVLDSGVDFGHPELAGQLLNGWNFVTPGTIPQDDYGHGTHMTGLIAANFDNGLGLAGLAPSVEILPYRVLNARGSGSITNVADAIRAAANSNARVINLSLFIREPHPLLEDAVRYAYSQGALVVASAGNCVLGQPCPIPVGYPAAYPEVMAIGATTLHDTRAVYSATGPELELSAPGGDIAALMLSTWPTPIADLCLAPRLRLDGGVAYCQDVGTSSAAALVSGGAALLLSVRPDLSAADVRYILARTAYPLALPGHEVGAGRLDLRAALRQITPAELNVAPGRIFHQDTAGTRPDAASANVETDLGIDHGRAGDTLAPPLRPPQTVTLTLTLENPSRAPVAWQATLAGGGQWARLVGPTSGQTRFEFPSLLTLVLEPTPQMIGRYQASIRLEGIRADGSGLVRFVPVDLLLQSPDAYRLLTPVMDLQQDELVAPQTLFTWEMPAPGFSRTVYGLTDNSVTTVELPFEFTFKGRSFRNFRLSSDGYISFPAAENDPGWTNRCLTNLIRPAHVIAGWWSDLNPSVGSGQIATFQSATGAYVVEFAQVALRAMPTQQVSFQIVLAPSGEIRLNYLQTPDAQLLVDQRIGVTVGVSAQYGRFYHQVYCSQDPARSGNLPHSRQSFRLTPADVY